MFGSKGKGVDPDREHCEKKEDGKLICEFEDYNDQQKAEKKAVVEVQADGNGNKEIVNHDKRNYSEQEMDELKRRALSNAETSRTSGALAGNLEG